MDRARSDSEAPPDDARLRQFQAIYRGEFAFVWAAARRLGVPPAAAEDVAQEVFLTAYRRLDHLRYEVSPRGWLYGVTRRVASRYRRGASRRALRLATLADMTPPAADATHARHELARRLSALLDQLGAGTREVWEMTELLGMSGPEIAGELTLPLNTVYSRLRLARARLQELVGEPAIVAAWTEALRRDELPPPRAERRSWAVLLPALGTQSTAPIVGTWVAARTAVATTMLVAGAALVIIVLPRRAAPPSPAAITAPARDRSPTTAAAAQPVADADALAREVALLDDARAALAAGRPDTALAWLDAHAREHPRGALVDAREAARVEVLCRQGRAAEAEAAARRLRAERPDSPITRHLENFRCTH